MELRKIPSRQERESRLLMVRGVVWNGLALLMILTVILLTCDLLLCLKYSLDVIILSNYSENRLDYKAPEMFASFRILGRFVSKSLLIISWPLAREDG